MLGVEAAREALIREVRRVFSMYGIAVDPRHINLVADLMTHGGGYRGCSRQGIGSNPSPLLKMSFETATKFLVDAAVFHEGDAMSTPSSRIVLGQVVDAGSGTFGLVHNL